MPIDQFIGGCTHSLKLFTISRDDQKSTNPIMLQRFLEGSLTNTLTAYLRELKLPDGPPHPSSRHAIDDSDDDSDDNQPPRGKALKKSKGTTSLHRGGTSRIHKVESRLSRSLCIH